MTLGENPLNSEAFLSFILETAGSFKAQDITVLKVSDVCDFADYFVLMSGTSTTHIQSLAEELVYKTKHAGHQPSSVEGMAKGEWCLLDYGDIVVHVFSPQKRSYYDLESLWKEAPVVSPDVNSVEA